MGQAAFLPLVIRVGLLATIVAFLLSDFPFRSPVTAGLSAWWAGRGMLGVLVSIGPAGYGFVLTPAARPLVSDPILGQPG